MSIVVNNKGKAAAAKVRKGPGCGLDKNAPQTVKSWRFKPARRNGTPIRARVMVEVAVVLGARELQGTPQRIATANPI